MSDPPLSLYLLLLLRGHMPKKGEEEQIPWRTLTWSEFCVWLQGRRVVSDTGEGDDATQTLTFDDGSVAELTSEKTDGSPGYSEYTPGSDGHLKTPTVRVHP